MTGDGDAKPDKFGRCNLVVKEGENAKGSSSSRSSLSGLLGLSDSSSARRWSSSLNSTAEGDIDNALLVLSSSPNNEPPRGPKADRAGRGECRTTALFSLSSLLSNMSC